MWPSSSHCLPSLHPLSSSTSKPTSAKTCNNGLQGRQTRTPFLFSRIGLIGPKHQGSLQIPSTSCSEILLGKMRAQPTCAHSFSCPATDQLLLECLKTFSCCWIASKAAVDSFSCSSRLLGFGSSRSLPSPGAAPPLHPGEKSGCWLGDADGSCAVRAAAAARHAFCC